MNVDWGMAVTAAIAAAIVGVLGLLIVVTVARRSSTTAAFLTPVTVVAAIAAGVVAGSRSMALDGSALAAVWTVLAAVFPIALVVGVLLARRTSALQQTVARETAERERLEHEMLEISEREQRRIGQDLHDGLCQQLAGIEMLSQVLAKKLAAKSKDGSARATEIAKAVREAISQTRLLARGLSPVTLESEGLMSALTELALNTEKMFHVRCNFDCPVVVKFNDHAAATHLFRIAQEAVSNAIKHGRAKIISIELRENPSHLHLQINDNGTGFPKKFSHSSGMGLGIMQSRINMVGGTVSIERRPDGGTRVVIMAPKIR